MTEAELDALDAVVAATGNRRYRHLVSDDNTRRSPNSPADWRRWVVAEAARLAAGAPDLPADYADRLPPPGGCCG